MSGWNPCEGPQAWQRRITWRLQWDTRVEGVRYCVRAPWVSLSSSRFFTSAHSESMVL